MTTFGEQVFDTGAINVSEIVQEKYVFEIYALNV